MLVFFVSLFTINNVVHLNTPIPFLKKVNDMDKKEQNGLFLRLSFLLCVFIFFLTFFVKVHPIVIYDADDWTYIGYIRDALPLWKSWNPTRVLPETVMGACGYVGAYLIKPFVNDYITSLTIAMALFLAIMITWYVSTVENFLRKQLQLPLFSSISLAIIYLLLHFVIYKNPGVDNVYMFYSGNATTYFYYLIPALFNSIIYFLILSCVQNSILKNHPLLMLGVYLAVLSNLYQSIILVSAAFCILIIQLYKQYKTNNLMNILCNNSLLCLIIILWLMVLIFEVNGGRAEQIGKSVFINLKETIHFLKVSLCGVSNMSKVYVLLSLCLGGGVAWFNRKILKIFNACLAFATLSGLCMIGNCMFLLLLCSKTFPRYISNPNVNFAFIFHLLILSVFSFGVVLHKYKRAQFLLPLMIYILLSRALTTSEHYKISNIPGIPSKTAMAISRFVVNQVVEAELAGKSEVALHVPVGDAKSNWPHATYLERMLWRTLYSHGIIDKHMKIKVLPDAEVNKRFYIK